MRDTTTNHLHATRVTAVSGHFTGRTGTTHGDAGPTGLGEPRTYVRFDDHTGRIPVITTNLLPVEEAK